VAWMSETSKLCGVMPPVQPQPVSVPILSTQPWCGGSWLPPFPPSCTKAQLSAV
jgi:hypothetical protein